MQHKITYTLNDLLGRYTKFSETAPVLAYMCYMYAADAEIPIEEWVGLPCDVLDIVRNLCPELFVNYPVPQQTFDMQLELEFYDEFVGDKNTTATRIANVRLNLIKYMIRKFGGEAEFTVNVG